MGYTNYWTYKKPFTNNEWDLVKKEYEYIKEILGSIVIDQTEKNNEIFFNGNPTNDQDHETFVLRKDFTTKSPSMKAIILLGISARLLKNLMTWLYGIF